jgi:hypothetical protein
VSVNDGKRECGDNVVQVQNSQPPFNSSNKTQMLICDPTFDITNIDKSYAIIDLTIPVKAHGLGQIDDPDHLLKIFIGYRSSNEIFRDTEVTSNGSSTGYKSNQLHYEGFAYSRNKCENELQRKRGVHTEWDAVFKYQGGICGTYINLTELSNGVTKEVKFQICVPFTNLLMFSFFNYLGKFPSFLANIILKDVLLSHHSLMWGMCSPANVRESKETLQGLTINSNYAPLNEIFFEHRFGQINNPLTIPALTVAGTDGTALNPYAYTPGEVTLMVASMTIQQWQSYIKGYMINDNAKRQIIAGIRQLGGIVFPAQQAFYYGFNNAPNARGLRVQTNISLFNTNCLIIGFPTTANQITVLTNPQLVGAQMQVNGNNIPHDKFDTTGNIHLRDQLGISSLDGVLSPSRDYENAIINEHNEPFAEDGSGGARYPNCLADDTSYLCQFPTERSDAAFIVDGVNSHGQNVPIQFEGVPKYPGPDDTYYIPIPGGEKNTNKPFLLEVRDTFWVLDLGGMHYFSEEVPRGSQTEEVTDAQLFASDRKIPYPRKRVPQGEDAIDA